MRRFDLTKDWQLGTFSRVVRETESPSYRRTFTFFRTKQLLGRAGRKLVTVESPRHFMISCALGILSPE